jgi:hypothetical protein
MEGSQVAGKLSVGKITVETEFGALEIPIARIVSFTPGLDSHPEERQRIARLIQQLGANDVKQRDEAQKQLVEMGLAIRNELERYRNDEDAERRSRVQKIITDLEEAEDDEEDPEFAARPVLISQDTVETTMFTVVGKISPKTFTVQTQFGQLTVALTDIRRGERDVAEKPEIRKSFQVTGNELVLVNYKNSGVRVQRGDRVTIAADGKIMMTPWGNNQFSTPDGSPNFQWYIPNKIPGGALVAKIGSSGKEFKVGSKYTFTATKSGVLHFAVAMNPQFANQGYNFPGEYTVKVRVNGD